jgi:hypothetical protein
MADWPLDFQTSWETFKIAEGDGWLCVRATGVNRFTGGFAALFNRPADLSDAHLVDLSTGWAFCCFLREQQLLKLLRPLEATVIKASRADKTRDSGLKDERFRVEKGRSRFIRREIPG